LFQPNSQSDSVRGNQILKEINLCSILSHASHLTWSKKLSPQYTIIPDSFWSLFHCQPLLPLFSLFTLLLSYWFSFCLWFSSDSSHMHPSQDFCTYYFLCPECLLFRYSHGQNLSFSGSFHKTYFFFDILWPLDQKFYMVSSSITLCCSLLTLTVFYFIFVGFSFLLLES
jgi:hypothetical protein